jgi:hypothetical protein
MGLKLVYLIWAVAKSIMPRNKVVRFFIFDIDFCLLKCELINYAAKVNKIIVIIAQML